MGDAQTCTLLDLFRLTRQHAKDTNDPSYKPIGPAKGKPAQFSNRNALHHTHRTVCVELPRHGVRQVPAGTEIVLYQDPTLSRELKTSVSVGTLHLPDLQVTLRGDGRVRCVDPTAERMFAGGRPGRLRTDE